MRLLSFLLLSTLGLPAQSVLTTTFAPNNGGSVGGTIYFDLAADAGAVVITSIDLDFDQSAGSSGTVDFYTTPGTRVGVESNQAAWTLFDTLTIASTAGSGAPSPGVWTNGIPFILTPSTSIGVALIANGLAHDYTNGSAPLQFYEECPLTLTAGAASNTPFGGANFSPRVVNTNIYFLSGADCARVEVQGTGCLPPNPLTLTATSGRPVQGAAPAAVDCTTSSIPANALIHVGWIGLSRPGVSLGLIGLPTACSLHATLDLIVDVTPGIVGSHTWTTATLPALPPSFSGFVFNAQAATLGVGFFDMEGRSSNGLKYTIGSL